MSFRVTVNLLGRTGKSSSGRSCSRICVRLTARIRGYCPRRGSLPSLQRVRDCWPRFSRKHIPLLKGSPFALRSWTQDERSLYHVSRRGEASL
ncbi:hypothetical protein CSUI_006725 [Cystoisospora suis]|uniref:Uncharacterized protein n=1 Tax=Cystoisospora suis TaxID=483139 RepID=A0A2C6KT13_9APIC|nr:hypothetical protein CSUI_006725 [Cystoisospora suis]